MVRKRQKDGGPAVAYLPLLLVRNHLSSALLHLLEQLLLHVVSGLFDTTSHLCLHGLSAPLHFFGHADGHCLFDSALHLFLGSLGMVRIALSPLALEVCR